MNLKILKNPIIQGTLILSLAGIFTRIIGFYYRIFLSNTIGAKGLGLYHMIFPIFSLFYAICVSGVQIATSKFTAAYNAKKEYNDMFGIVNTSIIIVFILSLLSMIICFSFSDFIAINILDDKNTSSLIKIMSFSIIFCSIHSCITGFFLGLKNTKIPAVTQIIEQVSRILFVLILTNFLFSVNIIPNVSIAVLGLVAGDFFSAVSSIFFYIFKKKKYDLPEKSKYYFKEIITLAYPISINRFLQSTLNAAESTLIPLMLISYGLTRSDALSIYGIFTGMALPLILFPSSITSSLSSLLLPSVSEDFAKNNYSKLKTNTSKLICYSTLLGVLFTIFFLVFGNLLCKLLFKNEDVAIYINILSWLCPFLYLCSTSCSILNGLGFTKKTCFHNILSGLIRLSFIVFFVPKIGIKGLLYGILVSYIICSLLHIFALYKELSKMVL